MAAAALRDQLTALLSSMFSQVTTYLLPLLSSPLRQTYCLRLLASNSSSN